MIFLTTYFNIVNHKNCEIFLEFIKLFIKKSLPFIKTCFSGKIYKELLMIPRICQKQSNVKSVII